MITEKELLEIGFKRLGGNEDDPFYKITFKPPFKFNVISISGNFTESGAFKLYANNTEYIHIENLKIVINVFGEPRTIRS